MYFNSEPARKYEAFANCLEYQLPDYYAESDARQWGMRRRRGHAQRQCIRPRACIWPVVFIPCLARTASRRSGTAAVGLFHVIPEAAIGRPRPLSRHRRGRERAFSYVAVTACTEIRSCVRFSHTGSNQLYRKRSAFFDHVQCQWFNLGTRACRLVAAAALEPRAATRRRT